VNGHFQARAPYARLIAATDGSELGGMALVGAAQLASRTKAELYVFHAAGDIEGEAAVTRQVIELLVTAWLSSGRMVEAESAPPSSVLPPQN
jgi:nucleotide-binding universal stress UspA family protein